MWRPLLSSQEKIVKHETFFFPLVLQEKKDTWKPIILPYCLYLYLLAESNKLFFPIRFNPFVCLLCYSQNCFSLHLLLVASATEVTQSPVCCDPATVCCQEIPVYVVVLFLWNIEWEQWLCHERSLPISLLYKKALHCLCRAWSLRSMLEWGDTAGVLCWEEEGS